MRNSADVAAEPGDLGAFAAGAEGFEFVVPGGAQGAIDIGGDVAVAATGPGRAHDFPQAHLADHDVAVGADRKSTRLNSSHVEISYAVFCLKKKKKKKKIEK